MRFADDPWEAVPKGLLKVPSFTIVHGMKQVRVIDSHTGGEPTRTVIDGGPDLGEGSLQQKRLRFQEEHDAFRRAFERRFGVSPVNYRSRFGAQPSQSR